MDSTNNQIKKKPILLALAATLCNRKMLKVKAPLYTEPLRLFLFYNCFKGQKDWKVDTKPEETKKEVRLITQKEMKKYAPFVKVNPWSLSQSGIIETIIYLKFLLRNVEDEPKKVNRNSMQPSKEEKLKHALSLSSVEY